MSLLTPLVDGGLTETQPHSIIIVNLVGSKRSHYFIAKMVLLFCKQFARIPNQQCIHLHISANQRLLVHSLDWRSTCTSSLMVSWKLNGQQSVHTIQTTFTSLITIDLCILFYIVLIPLHLKLIFVKHSLVQNNIS